MSDLDLEAIRGAVDAFTLRRPGRFSALTPVKDIVLELRRKGASYATIAEILSEHGLPVGRTLIADFCHQVLGDNKHPRPRKRTKKLIRPKASPAPPPAGPVPPTPSATPTPPSSQPTPIPVPNQRGPRIAKLRFSKSP